MGALCEKCKFKGKGSFPLDCLAAEDISKDECPSFVPVDKKYVSPQLLKTRGINCPSETCREIWKLKPWECPHSPTNAHHWDLDRGICKYCGQIYKANIQMREGGKAICPFDLRGRICPFQELD